jgi:TetR/AcrR family transcriptional regulator of autoinduction and epiphytic fitness
VQTALQVNQEERDAGSGSGGGEVRAPRSERTRLAVIDALLWLIEAGEPQPSAQRVAQRAGVSTRTVFAHFGSLEDLHRASAERVAARVVALLSPIAPDQPLAARIDALCDQRARVNEAIGPFRRAAALQEAASPALAAAREQGRQASLAQLNRIFAGELDGLERAARRACVATIDALLSGESWDLLRGVHALSADGARQAITAGVGTLLATWAPSTTAAAPPVDDARSPRLRAALDALADVDRRIERVVAAIEAGAPEDLLTPRLVELRAARLAAERDLAEARAGR